MLSVVVFGTPIPQGSTRAFTPKGWNRPIITAANAKTKPWRQAIVDAVREQMENEPPAEIPLSLEVVFYMPRPKSTRKSIREPAKKPDLDKLVRSVGDALTDAGVWRDDSQVVKIMATKAFAGGSRDPLQANGLPRAAILVRGVE